MLALKCNATITLYYNAKKSTDSKGNCMNHSLAITFSPVFITFLLKKIHAFGFEVLKGPFITPQINIMYIFKVMLLTWLTESFIYTFIFCKASCKVAPLQKTHNTNLCKWHFLTYICSYHENILLLLIMQNIIKLDFILPKSFFLRNLTDFAILLYLK